MQYRKDKYGNDISVLGFGCMRFTKKGSSIDIDKAEKEVMADILNSGLAEDINVYIGDENQKDELKDFSIITFKHKISGKDVGTIGIIGPKRMNYSKVISVMKYINKKLKDKGL